jgi:hypothetical protein
LSVRRIAAAILTAGLVAAPALATARPDPSFSVQLLRGACLGTCPVYTVTIDAAGQVVFTGGESGRGASIHCQGKRRWTIAPAAVAQLQAFIDSSGFFGFKDSYNSRITDLPTYIVTVTRHHRTKTVRDADGHMVGMPAAMTRIETAIDNTAADSACLTRAPPS